MKTTEKNPTVVYIGYSGLARVGKTTAAQHLRDILTKHGIPCKIMGFATPIRNGLKAMGINKESSPELFRDAAQFIGGRARQENPNWWMDRYEEAARQEASNHDIFVVICDDIRYPNEFCLFKNKEHSKTVFISHRLRNQTRLDMGLPLYSHESERFAGLVEDEIVGGEEFLSKYGTPARNLFNYVIANETDLEKYQERLDIYNLAVYNSISKIHLKQE